jgi:molybdopterin/thiamine biosynthesis adenylyltransferase
VSAVNRQSSTATPTSGSSHLDLETVECRLSGADDVYKAAEGADILLSAADRPKAEIMGWVNDAIVRHNIPMITGGLDTQRCLYYSVIPGVSGCIECWRRQVGRDDPASDRMLSRRRDDNIAGDKGAFVPMVVLVTGFVISEMVRIVTGIAPPMSAGKLTHGRFVDYDMTIAESWDRDPGLRRAWRGIAAHRDGRATDPGRGTADRPGRRISHKPDHRTHHRPAQIEANRSDR